MTNVQVRGLTQTRKQMHRAELELSTLRLRETTYRGVHYDVPNRPEEATHGTFVYRGRTYNK
jgi:hypothetical protein